MGGPGWRGERAPHPGGERGLHRPRAGESTRREASADQGAGPYDNPEAQLGGADAVEKTTYVVGDGTEPDARPHGDYAAGDAARGGANLGVWVIGGVAALIALVYAIGIFR
jgi:hypothetical protein